MKALRQESVVEIAERAVTVVSEVVLEPELLITTRVTADGEELRRSHQVLPKASTVLLRERGPAALAPALQAHHLRFLGTLISDKTLARAPSVSLGAGTLGRVVFAKDGGIMSRVGEDQVPDSWLRAAYMLVGIVDALETKLDLGSFHSASLHGSSLCAAVRRDGQHTATTFFESQGHMNQTLSGLGPRPA